MGAMRRGPAGGAFAASEQHALELIVDPAQRARGASGHRVRRFIEHGVDACDELFLMVRLADEIVGAGEEVGGGQGRRPEQSGRVFTAPPGAALTPVFSPQTSQCTVAARAAYEDERLPPILPRVGSAQERALHFQ